MCFAWSLAASTGPLWLVGDNLYEQECKRRRETGTFNEKDTIEVMICDPLKQTSEKKLVQIRHLEYIKTEIADPFPDPPPASFTWSHYAMLHELKHPELCLEVAKYWADKEVPPQTWSEANRFYAEWHIYFLWSWDDFTTRTKPKYKRVHVCLQEGAELLKKAMQISRRTTVEAVLLVVEFELDSIFRTFIQEQRNQISKQLCIKCGKKFMKKCLSCGSCGVRYCSQSCQMDDWDAHKVICRTPNNRKCDAVRE